MRILFTTLPIPSHFQPLIPIARAAAIRHEIAFACPPSFAATVEQAGFRAFPAGFDRRGRPTGEVFPGWLKAPEYQRAEWATTRLFAGVYATVMATDLLALCRDWHPDLIVRETTEFGGCVVAEALGLPHASVRSGATTADYTLRHRFREALATLRDLNGLPPDPEVAMPFRYLHLACEPPRFHPTAASLGPTAHLLRPVPADQTGDEALPAWVAQLPDRPTLYATLGTSINQSPRARATFAAILAAFRDAPYNVILTIGRNQDPAQFGPQPPHVHIERYIPQSLLLAHCDLVVHHGGFSTCTGTLSAGLPMVVLPISADQPDNAACCAALGVGKMLQPEGRTAEAIRAAAQEVLAEPSYRTNAQRMRNEMAALPGPEHAVALLERLAAEKQPLLTA